MKRSELLAAQNKVITDVIAPNLHVLFCGINPGLWSGITGNHFAKPGNRFWKTLHLAGFTPRQLAPSEELELLEMNLGITNFIARATATADELGKEEYLAGGETLRKKVLKFQPKFLAILGIGAFRTAFNQPKAGLGLQSETIGATKIWVLPNPSGLNAHYQIADLIRVYGELYQQTKDTDL